MSEVYYVVDVGETARREVRQLSASIVEDGRPLRPVLSTFLLSSIVGPSLDGFHDVVDGRLDLLGQDGALVAAMMDGVHDAVMVADR